MSWQASAYVDTLEDGLSRSEKLLLFVLADHHNPESGWAWPSVSRLARKTMLQERWVYKLLHALEERGLIEIEHNGGREPNRYRFPGLTPELKTPPVLQNRGALHSHAKQTSIEPITEEDGARFRAGKWAALCANLHVISGVDHLGYWKIVKDVPEISVALERLIHELVKYNTNMRLLPGSVKRLEIAAEILAPFDLNDSAFKVALPEIEYKRPDCLQLLAKVAPEWSIGIVNDYGKVDCG